MSSGIKIPKSLLERALTDLERPHPFAFERLGFFSCRQSVSHTHATLLAYDYHPIPDEHYIPDETCGARIGGDAIRIAMGRARMESAGQLWVHTHGRKVQPYASGTDQEEGPKVVRSLANAAAKQVHGWAVISENGIAGQIRLLDGSLAEMGDLTVLGWPMAIVRRPNQRRRSFFFGREGKNPKKTDRYDRQSFLGSNSQDIISNARIGIVGLGGGGSHICQQLAHIGFLHVVLCDKDRIDLTNLNRLVGGTAEDVRRKRLKTHIAARNYRRVQPTADVDEQPLHWEEKLTQLKQCDVIFGCLDSFAGRRDLEAFCRSQMIPLIDIGMKVFRPESAPPSIYGQVILSLPDQPCMQCVQFLTDENLSDEAHDYNAGPQPQVVWPNGVLASSAIGMLMDLLTGWSGVSQPACRLDYRGGHQTITPSNIAKAFQNRQCAHYPLSQAGDPILKTL